MDSRTQWIKDEPRVRDFEGKRIEIKGQGVFTMHVVETDKTGRVNPGYVIVLIEPWDLNAAITETNLIKDKIKDNLD